MKKILSVIIVIAMLAVSFMAYGGVALAANEALDVSTTVSELLEGTTVDFNATVTAGDTNLVNYKILYNGNVKYDSGGATLVAGDTKNLSFSMEVTTEMLGNPIQFVLAADSGSSLATDSVTIAKKQPTILLKASGVSNKKLAAKGDIITFTFSLENQGDVKLDDIVVTAPELNGGKPLRDAFSLDPKQSYNVVYKHTMDKEIVVNPVVNYKYNGQAQEKIVLDPIELKLEERNVVTTLTVDNQYPNAGEEVTFTYTISNEGNVPYTNLKVYIDGEEVDFPANNLNPGNTYSEDYVRSFTVSADVSFSTTLKDHAGQTVSAGTKTISIQLPVDSDALTGKLTFNMSVDRPMLTSNATINFTGNITNSSEYTLSDISVDEQTLGNIYKADELASASSKKIQYSANIEETTTYNFVLTVKDRNGKEYTVSAEPITVTIASAVTEDTEDDVFEDAPEVTDPGQELTLDTDDGGVGKLGILGIISIILIVLIIGVGVVLIVLWRQGGAPAKSTGRTPAAKKKAVRKPVKKPTRNYRDRNNF